MIVLTEQRDFWPNGISPGQWKGFDAHNPSQSCVSKGVVAKFVTYEATVAALKASVDKNVETTRIKWDRHSGGANYNFWDGHAKWHRIEATLNPDNYLYGDSWYPTPFAPWNTGCP